MPTLALARVTGRDHAVLLTPSFWLSGGALAVRTYACNTGIPGLIPCRHTTPPGGPRVLTTQDTEC